jgi:hypothetical protein
MSSRFKTDANRIFAEKDGAIVFDTSRKSVNLFPDSTRIINSSLTIDFPEFYKANAYLRRAEGAGAVCRSYITILPQEWGPGRAYQLDDITLGNVPAETDYLDIRVVLTQTNAPDDFSGVAKIFPIMPQGVSVNVPSGSCPLELGGGVSRLVEFVRSGNSIIMRRYQSIADIQPVTWIPGNDDSSISGWTYDYRSNKALPFGSLVGSRGIIVKQIDQRGPTPLGNDRRRAFNNDRCNCPGRSSYVDPTDFSSTWSGSIIIHPGRRS